MYDSRFLLDYILHHSSFHFSSGSRSLLLALAKMQALFKQSSALFLQNLSLSLFRFFLIRDVILRELIGRREQLALRSGKSD